MTVQEYARVGSADGALRDREASRRVERVGEELFHRGQAGSARRCFHLPPSRGGCDPYVLNHSSKYVGAIAGGTKMLEVPEDGNHRRGQEKRRFVRRRGLCRSTTLR